MKPWSVLVGSLLRERPPTPDFLSGGRGAISHAARQATYLARKAQRTATENSVLDVMEQGDWWKVPEVALRVERDRMYITKVMKDLMDKGALEGVQNRGERREWYFRRPTK